MRWSIFVIIGIFVSCLFPVSLIFAQEKIAAIVEHADRRGPLEAYLTGLLLPGERKSVEPMAALIDSRHVGARHQSMHHFVANA